VRALLAAVTCEKSALDANLALHLELMTQAADAGCSLAVFPEFSLTGSVDPARAPNGAITIDHPAVAALSAATRDLGVAAVFGLSERSGGRFFITQAVAGEGRLIGVQRKRHLGEGEATYSTSADALVFELRSHHIGIIICAEAGVDFTWDATRDAGADTVMFCSAPGLHGRRTNDVAMHAGFEWWLSCGLADARRHARRLGITVAMSTQAGSTVDEEFPGLAALISPRGDILDRLPDWRPGTLVVEL
jgi:predicted amidohydrolase